MDIKAENKSGKPVKGGKEPKGKATAEAALTDEESAKIIKEMAAAKAKQDDESSVASTNPEDGSDSSSSEESESEAEEQEEAESDAEESEEASEAPKEDDDEASESEEEEEEASEAPKEDDDEASEESDEDSSEVEEDEEKDKEKEKEKQKESAKESKESMKKASKEGSNKKGKADSKEKEEDEDDSESSADEEPEVTKKTSKEQEKKESKKEPKKDGKKESKKKAEPEKKEPSKKDSEKEKDEKKTKEKDKSEKEKKRKEKEDEPKEKDGKTKKDSKGEEKKEKKEKKDKEKKRSKEAEEEGSSSKLAKAESSMAEKVASDDEKINSSTHHKEYLRYKRWITNGKRFPTVLGSRLTTEDGRAKLFVDWVKCGGDVDAIICKHEQSLTESQASQVKWGFRSEKWVIEKHGEEKGKRIIERKKTQGLYIADPEEPEDSLYFCLIDIDLKNINELKKVTSLEAKGQVSDEMLKAFTTAGGVLDPQASLKGDLLGGKEGMSKAIAFMGSKATTGEAKGKGGKRKRGAANAEETPTEVKVETPVTKAKTLITKVLKDANTCRWGFSSKRVQKVIL